MVERGGERVRCVGALRDARERRRINSARFHDTDVQLKGAVPWMTYDRLRHDALHLGCHGACCREASGTGARRGAALLWARESNFGKAPPVARRVASTGRARQESHRFPRAVEWRSLLARRVRRPSSVVAEAKKECSARMGIQSGIQNAFSTRSPCDSKLANLFLRYLLPQPRARPQARHEDAPHTALRLSGAMGGSRNSGRRVGGGGLGSVRPRLLRAPRCRHARPPPPPPRFLESACCPSTPSPDTPYRLCTFPRRLVDDRVSRARLLATARTSAATTDDTSSRATTATSRISTPTARSDRICAQ